jgi:Domain of unknown function (DUF4352)
VRNRSVWFVGLFAAIVMSACSTQTSPLTSASGPLNYPSGVTPPIERIAIFVTITNHGTDDLVINPADFVARDADHRVYPSDPAATISDGNLVRLSSSPGPDALPLPTITLRQADVLSGFIVFDVPLGVRPLELVWRQSDTDQVASLSALT